MSRGKSILVRSLVLVVVAGLFAGCATRRLKAENENLKAQVLQLSDALASTQADANRMAEESAALQSQLAKTQSDYAAKSAELEEMSNKLRAQGFDVSVRGGMVVVTMPQTVLFNSGSATVSTGGKTRLTQLAQALNSDFKTFSIEIQGHTDTDPIRLTKDKYKSNWELSYDRAQTVAYYLMESAKVDAKRVHVAAYGQYKPVAANSSAEGKAKNRRVEILVIRPAGQ